ncbi:lytic transglycosylase domain-containing protein [Sphingomonas sp. TX0522]|nr:lytic transglycosylase domain-containing protein [Sphingomonas sp. TX0522]
MVAALHGLPLFSSSAIAQTVAEAQPTRDPIAAHVAEASQRFGVPEAWIYAVMGVESAGDIDATSIKGAMGLMQVLPGTYDELRRRYGLGRDAYDPRDNILAGTAYLREMYDRYGSPGFLAAYNAGPGRYEQHLAGRALPLETRTYLARLAPAIGGHPNAGLSAAPDPHAWTRAGLFAGRSSAILSVTQSSTEPTSAEQPTAQPFPRMTLVMHASEGLFVPLSGATP